VWVVRGVYVSGRGDRDVDAWHFLDATRTLRYGPRAPVALGATLRLPDGATPELCVRGFHASLRALDALPYAPESTGLVLCRVRLGGTVVHGSDKLTASERTVLAWVDADPILHEFACWCVEAALYGASFHAPVDPRSLRALQVKRAWMRGDATDAGLAAARDAACDAASAACDAASAAAWSAASAAARAAAWSAWSAWSASDAAMAAANTKLEAMALEAMGLPR
jgi:hypothetical protein